MESTFCHTFGAWKRPINTRWTMRVQSLSVRFICAHACSSQPQSQRRCRTENWVKCSSGSWSPRCCAADARCVGLLLNHGTSEVQSQHGLHTHTHTHTLSPLLHASLYQEKPNSVGVRRFLSVSVTGTDFLGQRYCSLLCTYRYLKLMKLQWQKINYCNYFICVKDETTTTSTSCVASINHKPDLVSLLRRAEPFWLSRVEEPEVSLKTQTGRFALKRNQPPRAFQLYTLFNTLFATVETRTGKPRENLTFPQNRIWSWNENPSSPASNDAREPCESR